MASAGGEAGTPTPAVAVPVVESVKGQLIAGFNDKDKNTPESKYARMRTVAKWVNSICSALLAIVCLIALFYQTKQGASSCNPLLVRTVMLWMSLLGIMMVLAELDVKVVRKYVHVLAYRSGRATIGIMTGTIVMSAAPVELPMAASGYNYNEGAMVLSVQYQYLIVGFLMVCAAIYNIRVSVKAKVYKLHTRNKLEEEDGPTSRPYGSISGTSSGKKDMM